MAGTARDRDLMLQAVLVALTITTGLIDAVSVLGLGRVFTANMTGNIVFLGFAIAGAPGFSPARSVTAIAAFLAGAIVGGRLGLRLDASRHSVGSLSSSWSNRACSSPRRSLPADTTA